MSEKNPDKLIKIGGILLLVSFISFVGYWVGTYVLYLLGVPYEIRNIITEIFWPAFFGLMIAGLILIVIGSFMSKRILMGVGAVLWLVKPAYSLNFNIMSSMGMFSSLPSFVYEMFYYIDLVIMFVVLAALILFIVHEKTAGDMTKIGYVVVALVFYCILVFDSMSYLITGDRLIYELFDNLGFGIYILEDVLIILLYVLYRFHILFMGVYFVNEGNR